MVYDNSSGILSNEIPLYIVYIILPEDIYHLKNEGDNE
jgi:hypothetical protein